MHGAKACKFSGIDVDFMFFPIASKIAPIHTYMYTYIYIIPINNNDNYSVIRTKKNSLVGL